MLEHTFGGPLLSRFIDYETTDGSGDPAGTAPAAADAGAGPAAPPAPSADASGAAASSGEPAAPAWAGPSQDEWNALQEQNRQLIEWAQQQTNAAPAAPAGQPQGEITLDQLAAAYEQAVIDGDARMQFAITNELQRRAVADALAPLMPTVSAAGDQIAEQTVTRWMTELQVPDDDREFVAFLAHGFVPRDDNGDIIPGYGQQATAQAHQRLADRDKRVADAAVERYKAELAAVAGAPTDATSGVPGVIDDSQPRSLGDVVKSFMERQAAGRAA